MIKRSGLRTDLELLVNDAILLGKPVDAVVALAHPKTKKRQKIVWALQIKRRKRFM